MLTTSHPSVPPLRSKRARPSATSTPASTSGATHYGQSLPYSSESLVSSDCAACLQEREEEEDDDDLNPRSSPAASQSTDGIRSPSRSSSSDDRTDDPQAFTSSSPFDGADDASMAAPCPNASVDGPFVAVPVDERADEPSQATLHQQVVARASWPPDERPEFAQHQRVIARASRPPDERTVFSQTPGRHHEPPGRIHCRRA